MQQDMVVGSRLGVSLGIAQVEVFASAAARAAVLEAERIAQVAVDDDTATLTYRPTRLADLLVTSATGRAEVHAVLRDVAEAQAQLHALQAAALSRLAELQPRQSTLPGSRADDPDDPDRPDDWVPDEVAVVLGIGTGTASVLVDRQRALVEQLPRVWEALADGRVDVRRAQVLVDALAHRKRSAGGSLDDDVVDAVAARGLRWIGEGIGPTPLADRIGGALVAADPAEAQRRAERRKRKQNVSVTGCGDGLAGLRADLLDAADAAAMQAVLDAMAATMHKAGDRRPIGQLRVDALKQLLTRPWDSVPDEVARACWHLRLQVDLADLDDLGPVPDDLGSSSDSSPAPAPTGSRVGSVGRLPVTPVAVAEVLARFGALTSAGPIARVDGGEVWFEVVDGTGRLRAVASAAELRAAVRRGGGLGPPPPVDRYAPSAAQTRFVKARDRHCRFPGCARPAEYADLDHVVPRDHDDPAAGGPTCVSNLVCLCRRHHRLKTHARGWVFAMDADGTLHVTPPGGPTRTTRPAGMAEVDMSIPTCPDVLTGLFGRTPARFRSPTPDDRAARRQAAVDRARLAAEIEAELDAALARAAAGTPENTPTADEADPPPF
ncbi:HNH endonuclease signature motif containing protein [Klenkia taihuensis]|uniref:HNH nuclease domain-containing protein n=1 Tax=Klenkia taihuensis TaxID=1225127 RepID=A0A1I1TI87_9ACTN|nr:HNH endonuclease signature motif containing protein [Klenkia taihuensis]SFD58245.1 protein of unknown function [Klenkia taihuensis]